MIKYELMFIIKPTVEDDKKETIIETVKGIITGDGGTVENVDIWGMKKLAYEIQKLTEGYYVVMDFEADAELPKELERRLRISEDIMRHMIVRKPEK